MSVSRDGETTVVRFSSTDTRGVPCGSCRLYYVHVGLDHGLQCNSACVLLRTTGTHEENLGNFVVERSEKEYVLLVRTDDPPLRPKTPLPGFRSASEKAHLLSLSKTFSVVHYERCAVLHPCQGSRATYTPDFIVSLGGLECVFVESKAAPELADDPLLVRQMQSVADVSHAIVLMAGHPPRMVLFQRGSAPVEITGGVNGLRKLFRDPQQDATRPPAEDVQEATEQPLHQGAEEAGEDVHAELRANEAPEEPLRQGEGRPENEASCHKKIKTDHVAMPVLSFDEKLRRQSHDKVEVPDEGVAAAADAAMEPAEQEENIPSKKRRGAAPAA